MISIPEQEVMVELIIVDIILSTTISQLEPLGHSKRYPNLVGKLILELMEPERLRIRKHERYVDAIREASRNYDDRTLYKTATNIYLDLCRYRATGELKYGRASGTIG